DVRFVAATNARLGELVESGSFRADLYYRLCVFAVTLPPLRERHEDVTSLAMHFLDKHNLPDRARSTTLSAHGKAALLAYPWPGNVRELESAMIRAVRLCGGGPIHPEHLGLPSERGLGAASPGTFRSMKREIISRFERDYLTRLMQDAHGNVTRA